MRILTAILISTAMIVPSVAQPRRSPNNDQIRQVSRETPSPARKEERLTLSFSILMDESLAQKGTAGIGKLAGVAWTRVCEL